MFRRMSGRPRRRGASALGVALVVAMVALAAVVAVRNTGQSVSGLMARVAGEVGGLNAAVGDAPPVFTGTTPTIETNVDDPMAAVSISGFADAEGPVTLRLQDAGSGVSDDLAFTDNGDGSGIIQGTPGQAGAFTLSVVATDTAGQEVGTGPIAFTVHANRQPTFTGSLPSVGPFAENEAITAFSLAGFQDPDGDSLTYSLSDAGSGIADDLTVTGHGTYTAEISGTPRDWGSVELTVTATDPDGQSVAAGPVVFEVTYDRPFVIMAAGDHLRRYATADGSEITTGGWPVSLGSSFAAAVAAADDEFALIGQFGSNDLDRVDLASASAVGDSYAVGSGHFPWVMVAGDQGLTFFGDGNNNPAYPVHAVDKYGAIQWSNAIVESSMRTRAMALDDIGHLYAGFMDGPLVRLEASDGSYDAVSDVAYPLGGAGLRGLAVTPDGNSVYVGGVNGRIVDRLDANLSSVGGTWPVDLGGDGIFRRVQAMAADGSGGVIAGVSAHGDGNGRLYRLNASGSILWSAAVNGGVLQVRVDETGEVYAQTGSHIYRYSASGAQVWATPVTDAGQGMDLWHP